MPIIKSLMKSLTAQYGDKKAKDIYYGMETKSKKKKASKRLKKIFN
jgi:hypothetical protein